jgi:L-cysteine:1D-myo-inositol 2-amino-2-deoxy-alpha-D-glucopyranoside ligase
VEAWFAPKGRPLPGRGSPLRLHDTATATVRPTSPGPVARIYVCGITPYDATHLGHAATYVAFDLVHRYWLDSGHRVQYAQNVTDVDDPLLERAVGTGQDWAELARSQTRLFADDMAALLVLPPTSYVGVVESLPSVSEWIARLRKLGCVYPVGSDLYAAVTEAPGFGSVSLLTRPQMTPLFAERGGDPQRQGKRDALDCLVWRGERPHEPTWDLPIGRGRPGWHIGCTAIALDHLGTGFDVQGGGSDLAFPHHEMCAALARAATGAEAFARHYVHAGMVGLDGEKMSKSLGNLVFVSALRRSGAEPAALRLALLAHHYRGDWEWRDAEAAVAQARLVRWRAALARTSGPSGEGLLRAVRERIADDLDAPGALTLVDAWASAALAGEGADRAAPDLVRDLLGTLLGVAVS